MSEQSGEKRPPVEGVLSWAHTPPGQAIIQQTINDIKVRACLLSGRMPADRNPFPMLRAVLFGSQGGSDATT